MKSLMVMENLSERTLVMILCGGRGERLYPLTRDRSKPSVPFLGSYRIIDFSLSNCLNSGLRRIALLTQYKSLSLERHIRYGWNIFHPESQGFVISLPAQGRVGDHWYEGTADAVFQNIYTIQKENPETVLILSGDHIYQADFRKLLKYHADKKADVVFLAKPVKRPDARRFGVIEVNRENKIQGFLEKPKNPPPLPGDGKHSLISMGVYLFKTPALIRALIRDAKNTGSTHDFGRDILPFLIKGSPVFAYPFDDYWEDIGTIEAYWNANMAFLSCRPPFELRETSWPMRTYQGQYPPSFVERSSIKGSLISPGCTICGASIMNSVISPGVYLGKNTQVLDSIIYEGVQIGKNVRLRKVIIDKYSRIPDSFEIGYDDRKDGKYFKIYGEGIRIVPKNWRLE